MDSRESHHPRPSRLLVGARPTKDGRHPTLHIDALLKASLSDLRGAFADAEGKPMKPVDVRKKLFNMKAKGVRYLPIGPRCNGWTDEKGCPGHVELR